MTASKPDGSTTTALDDTIDALLQRYLVLLDEYTTLRSSLNQLQSGIYQNIARANSSAGHGLIRYGQDHYDNRMQAIRRVVIQPAAEEGTDSADTAGGDGSGSFSFKVVVGSFSNGSGVVKENAMDGAAEEKEKEKPVSEEVQHEEANKENLHTPPGKPAAAAAASQPPPTASQEMNSEQAEADDDGSFNGNEEGKENDNLNSESDEGSTGSGSKKPKSADPLRWFGFNGIPPHALRQAQAQAIKAVEEILPRLVAVNMAMAEVEVEVRRARKKRTKIAAAAVAAAR